MDTIKISKYTVAGRPEVLRLLPELHSDYFFQNASPQIQQLQQDKDARKSFEDYLDFIEKSRDEGWLVLLARPARNYIAGFIIGSITTDNSLVLGKVGKVEDWFVEQRFRKRRVGMQLYNELEKWFVEKACKQILSDTWQGNELSIKVHLQAGFFISGISFSKKL